MAQTQYVEGDIIEVAGDPDDGFPNSWWEATIIGMRYDGRNGRLAEYQIRYKEFSPPDDIAWLPPHKTRPSVPDDSRQIAIEERQVGDAVEGWHEGGWWEGYVFDTFDDCISVIFPATKQHDEPHNYIMWRGLLDEDETAFRVRHALEPRRSRWEWKIARQDLVQVPPRRERDRHGRSGRNFRGTGVLHPPEMQAQQRLAAQPAQNPSQRLPMQAAPARSPAQVKPRAKKPVSAVARSSTMPMLPTKPPTKAHKPSSSTHALPKPAADEALADSEDDLLIHATPSLDAPQTWQGDLSYRQASTPPRQPSHGRSALEAGLSAAGGPAQQIAAADSRRQNMGTGSAAGQATGLQASTESGRGAVQQAAEPATTALANPLQHVKVLKPTQPEGQQQQAQSNVQEPQVGTSVQTEFHRQPSGAKQHAGLLPAQKREGQPDRRRSEEPRLQQQQQPVPKPAAQKDSEKPLPDAEPSKAKASQQQQQQKLPEQQAGPGKASQPEQTVHKQQQALAAAAQKQHPQSKVPLAAAQKDAAQQKPVASSKADKASAGQKQQPHSNVQPAAVQKDTAQQKPVASSKADKASQPRQPVHKQQQPLPIAAQKQQPQSDVQPAAPQKATIQQKPVPSSQPGKASQPEQTMYKQQQALPTAAEKMQPQQKISPAPALRDAAQQKPIALSTPHKSSERQQPLHKEQQVPPVAAQKQPPQSKVLPAAVQKDAAQHTPVTSSQPVKASHPEQITQKLQQALPIAAEKQQPQREASPAAALTDVDQQKPAVPHPDKATAVKGPDQPDTVQGKASTADTAAGSLPAGWTREDTKQMLKLAADHGLDFALLASKMNVCPSAGTVEQFYKDHKGRFDSKLAKQDSFKSKTSTGTSQPASRPSSASDKPAQQSSRPVHTPAAPAQAGKQLLSKASSKLTTTSSSSAVAAGTIALDGAAKPLAKAAQPGKAAAQAATKPGASWGPAGRAKVPDAAWAKQPRQASVGPQPADSSDQPSSSMSKQRSSSQQPRPGSAAAGGVKPQQRSVRAGSVDSNREAESKEVQQDGEGEEEAAPVLPAKEHADMLNSFLQRATTSKEGGQILKQSSHATATAPIQTAKTLSNLSKQSAITNLPQPKASATEQELHAAAATAPQHELVGPPDKPPLSPFSIPAQLTEHQTEASPASSKADAPTAASGAAPARNLTAAASKHSAQLPVQPAASRQQQAAAAAPAKDDSSTAKDAEEPASSTAQLASPRKPQAASGPVSQPRSQAAEAATPRDADLDGVPELQPRPAAQPTALKPAAASTQKAKPTPAAGQPAVVPSAKKAASSQGDSFRQKIGSKAAAPTPGDGSKRRASSELSPADAKRAKPDAQQAASWPSSTVQRPSSTAQAAKEAAAQSVALAAAAPAAGGADTVSAAPAALQPARLSSADEVMSWLPPQEPSPPAGTRLCIDFIGAGVRSDRLLIALRQQCSRLVDCKAVSHRLEEDAGECRSGWAVLFFRTHADTVEAYQKLRNVYMVTKTSPIPRPLLVHWPAKPQYCQEHMPGYLAHVDVTPHFAQPNSVEFQPAVEWRHLDITWLGLKWRVHDMHADQLAQIMEVYVKETGTTTTEQTNPPPPPTAPTAMLWLRNLPANAVQHRDVLERAFKQWGVKNVRLVHDPATEEGPPMGHALVQLREHAQAVRVLKDINEMVFLAAGTPRLVVADMAVSGHPRAGTRQDVYDAALRKVFKQDDHEQQNHLRIVCIEAPKSREEIFAVRLRAQMEKQTRMLVQMRKVGQQKQEELHQKHKSVIDGEMQKLMDLHDLVTCQTMQDMCKALSKPMPKIKGRLKLPNRYIGTRNRI